MTQWTISCHKLKVIKGIPFIAISTPERRCQVDIFELNQKYPKLVPNKWLTLQYRGVSVERLSNVLENGVDVLPTTAPIYCDFFDKALEYGGLPKLVMGFDVTHLDKTFREVPSSIDSKKLDELIEVYPTIEKSIDDSTLWLSRLQYDDPRRTSNYEIEYAYWIPKSPWRALKVVFIIDAEESHLSEYFELES